MKEVDKKSIQIKNGIVKISVFFLASIVSDMLQIVGNSYFY